jgi:hypothetical protein
MGMRISSVDDTYSNKSRVTVGVRWGAQNPASFWDRSPLSTTQPQDRVGRMGFVVGIDVLPETWDTTCTLRLGLVL